ncbi:hypothetical protein Ancab_013605, partial [Ancistrocladus abbreviatus]
SLNLGFKTPDLKPFLFDTAQHREKTDEGLHRPACPHLDQLPPTPGSPLTAVSLPESPLTASETVYFASSGRVGDLSSTNFAE